MYRTRVSLRMDAWRCVKAMHARKKIPNIDILDYELKFINWVRTLYHDVAKHPAMKRGLWEVTENGHQASINEMKMCLLCASEYQY